MFSDRAVGDNAKKQDSMRETLYTCLDNGLRLLQPFMPFVSEELYQRLPRRETENYESICIAPYPVNSYNWNNEQVEKDVKLSQDIIRSIRQLRASFNLTKEKPKSFINLTNNDAKKSLEPLTDVLAFLSQSSQIELLLNSTEAPEGCAVEIVNETCQVYLTIKGLVDISTEIEKLERKKVKTQGEFDKLDKQTKGPNYHKIPDNVKAENTKKLESLSSEIDIAAKTIENYKKFL